MRMFGYYSFREFQEMVKEEKSSKNRDNLNNYIGSNKQKQRIIKRKKGRK